MRGFINIVSGWAIALSALGAGCTYYPRTSELDGRFQPAAEALDKLKWYVDAYGSASISMPLLVQPDDSFKFNLTKVGPDAFFDSAKNEVDGRSAGVFQTAHTTGLDVSASVDFLAMQQYFTSLGVFQQGQATVAHQQQLANEAAMLRYQAAVASARAIEDPAKQKLAIADALTQLSQSVSSPSVGAPAPVAPASPDLPSAATIANGASALVPGFAAPQSLFAAGTPSVSGDTRSALLLAAGDTATNAILALLGDPAKMTKFQGKRVLFGVSMVSLNPGWKTKEGYSADVTAHLAYRSIQARPAVRDAFLKSKADPKAGSPIEQAALEQLQACVAGSLTATFPEGALSDADPRDTPFAGTQFAPYVYKPSDHTPLVAAISPMADAQSLDLQSSTRRRTERALQIALALSYVGAKAQGSFFDNFAKQAQNDTETRTHNAIVNAYSDGGGVFGFRMHPRLEADPDKGEHLRQLEPWSFPTLIIVGTDDEDLRPRVLVKPSVAGEKPQCFVVEPQLELFNMPRWIPEENHCRRHRIDGDCVGLTLTEEESFRVRNEVHLSVLGPMTEELDRTSGEACGDKQKAAKEACFGRRDSAGCGEKRRVHDECSAEYTRRTAHARFMLQKAELLKSMFSGETRYAYLPVEYLQPTPSAPAAKPATDTTAPAEVTLEVDETGTPKALDVNMLIAGTDLDQVDLTKIDFAAGKSQVVGALKPKAIGKGAILVSFQVNSDGPIVLKLPTKDPAATLMSAPLVVHRPRELTVTTSSKNKDVVVTDTVRYSPGTPAPVVRSQIERNKLHYPDEHPPQKADIKLQVQAAGVKP